MRNVIISIALSALPFVALRSVNQEQPFDVFLDRPESFGCIALVCAVAPLSVAGAIVGSGKDEGGRV